MFLESKHDLSSNSIHGKHTQHLFDMCVAAQFLNGDLSKLAFINQGKKHWEHAHLMLLFPRIISQERPNKPVAQQ